MENSTIVLHYTYEYFQRPLHRTERKWFWIAICEKDVKFLMGFNDAVESIVWNILYENNSGVLLLNEIIDACETVY